MINPKELDLTTLPHLPIEERKKLPRISGIYFAIDSKNNIQYIGKTTNLKKDGLIIIEFTSLKISEI